MKVTLLACSNNEKVADVASAICLDKHYEAMNNASSLKNLKGAINSGHMSVVEHLYMTFLVENISRACSHQLVRHRIASYSQQSQRYAKVDTDKEWYITPRSIKDNEYSNGEYIYLMDKIAEAYNEMCEDGIPEEDARMILPNACFTSIVISMNARAFIEACTKRTCNKAQWEIKTLFVQMRNLIENYFPDIYNKCFPSCETKGICFEAKPCGKEF